MILCGANALNITEHSSATSYTAAEYQTSIPPTEGWARTALAGELGTASLPQLSRWLRMPPWDHVTHKDCKSAYSRWDGTKIVSGKYQRI